MWEITEILSAFLGTLGFSVVFRSKRNCLLPLALGGALAWAVYLFTAAFSLSESLCCFIASAIAGIYSEILARILKTPTTNIFIPAVLPLVPGSSLYYTMRYAVAGEWEAFLSRGEQTLKIALAIALGIITVSTAVKLIFPAKRKN